MDKSIIIVAINENFAYHAVFSRSTQKWKPTLLRSLTFFYKFSSLFFQVFVGSASEGLLMAGDKVVGINHQGLNFVF